MQGISAGLPSGMPGIGLDIDNPIQHAPQPVRHSILTIRDQRFWCLTIAVHRDDNQLFTVAATKIVLLPITTLIITTDYEEIVVYKSIQVRII